MWSNKDWFSFLKCCFIYKRLKFIKNWLMSKLSFWCFFRYTELINFMACVPNTVLPFFATSMYTLYNHPCFRPQLTIGVSHLFRRRLLSHLTMSTEERRKRAVSLYNSHIYWRQDISQGFNVFASHNIRSGFRTNCFSYAII